MICATAFDRSSVRNDIARLLLEEGRFGEAETWLRESGEHTEENAHHEHDFLSDALLAHALAGQGKLQEATTMVEQAAVSADSIKYTSTRFQLKAMRSL